MNDAYLPGMSSILQGPKVKIDKILGAMVLGHSLKDRGAKAPLVAFVVVDKLSTDTITELRVRLTTSDPHGLPLTSTLSRPSMTM